MQRKKNDTLLIKQDCSKDSNSKDKKIAKNCLYNLQKKNKLLKLEDALREMGETVWKNKILNEYSRQIWIEWFLAVILRLNEKSKSNADPLV